MLHAASPSRLEAHEQLPFDSDHIFLFRETQDYLFRFLLAFRIIIKALLLVGTSSV